MESPGICPAGYYKRRVCKSGEERTMRKGIQVKTTAFAVLLYWTGVFLYAQSTPQSTPQGDSSSTEPTAVLLSLEVARTLAVANSRSLQRYNLAIESSLLTEKAQIFTYLPSLSLTGSASMTLWNTGNGDILLDSLRAGASIGIRETITLYEGGKNKILRSINALSTETVRQNALAEYYAVINGVDAAYYAVLQARANLEAAKTSLHVAASTLEAAQVRYDNNMISYRDLLQALSEHESVNTSKKTAERTLVMNLTRLRNITGVSGTIVLDPIDFNAYEEIITFCLTLDEETVAVLEERLWLIMRQHSPDLAKAEIARQTSEKNLELAGKDYLPTLRAELSTGLNYQYQYGRRNTPPPFTGSLSLNLSVPLDFWVIKNKIDRQKLSAEQSQLSYLDTVSNLRITTQTAILDLVLQSGTALSARRAYEYAQHHFQYVSELYNMSQISMTEYCNAANQAYSSQNRYNDTRFAFLQAISRIRALGAFETEEDVLNFLLGKTEE